MVGILRAGAGFFLQLRRADSQESFAVANDGFDVIQELLEAWIFSRGTTILVRHETIIAGVLEKSIGVFTGVKVVEG